MKSKVLLLWGLGFLFLAQVSASKKSCACGLASGGTNLCSCQQLVVRPPKPQKIINAGPRVVCHKLPGVPKLEPVGDLCTCGTSYVQPAILPRQKCSACQARQAYYDSSPEVEPLPYIGKRSFGFSQSSYQPTFYSDYENTNRYEDNYVQEEEIGEENLGGYGQYPLSPADAVSLSLAYGLAQNNAKAIREEGLLYGPKSIPKDGAIKKVVSNIPEERLQNYEKQVVELRIPPAGYGCSRAALEAEAEAALLAEQEQELEAEEIGGFPGNRYLSYSDLGYVPATGKQQEFIVGQNAYEEDIGYGGGGYGGGEYAVVEQDEPYIRAGRLVGQQEEYYENSGEYASSEEDEGHESNYNVISSSGGGGGVGGGYGSDSGILLQALGGSKSSCGCGGR